MSSIANPGATPLDGPAGGHAAAGGRGTTATALDWLSTLDHKRIGVLYLTTAFGFFLFAGVLALVMRAELAVPGLQLVDAGGYSGLFTMHGTIMLLLFGTPVVAAFANYLVPLQIGAADMVFPRLNALSYWLFLFGGLLVMSGYLSAGGPADVGWTAYPPNSELTYSTTTGTDLWIVGLMLTGLSTILGAINFTTTILTRRAPGMTMTRMSIFCWNILVTAILILFAFPALTGALAMLLIDRQLGADFFNPAAGGEPDPLAAPLLVLRPPRGLHPGPAVLRDHLRGHPGLLAQADLRLQGARVRDRGASAPARWACGPTTCSRRGCGRRRAFFSATSFVDRGADRDQDLQLAGHDVARPIRLELPMAFALGLHLPVPARRHHGRDRGLAADRLPGPGHLLRRRPFPQRADRRQPSAVFAGIYFWFPKMTGRRLPNRPGWLHFWLWVIGFTLTFVPQYQLGAEGMPRRIADYSAATGWQGLNVVSTIGAMVMGISILPFLYAVVVALRRPADRRTIPGRATRSNGRHRRRRPSTTSGRCRRSGRCGRCGTRGWPRWRPRSRDRRPTATRAPGGPAEGAPAGGEAHA